MKSTARPVVRLVPGDALALAGEMVVVPTAGRGGLDEPPPAPDAVLRRCGHVVLQDVADADGSHALGARLDGAHR